MKIDLKKEMGELYRAKKVPSLIQIPEATYLRIDGEGHPGSDTFQEAIEALYTLSYLIKFTFRDQPGAFDYGVMPLEVWWTVDRQVKGRFTWTAGILQPNFVGPEQLAGVMERACAKTDPQKLAQVRLETVNEGFCVHALHAGEYEKMNDTLAKMSEYARAQGYTPARDTHDIYLNDSRKTRPENLKTIMRLAVAA